MEEVAMQVTKLLGATSCDLRRVHAKAPRHRFFQLAPAAVAVPNHTAPQPRNDPAAARSHRRAEEENRKWATRRMWALSYISTHPDRPGVVAGVRVLVKLMRLRAQPQITVGRSRFNNRAIIRQRRLLGWARCRTHGFGPFRLTV